LPEALLARCAWGELPSGFVAELHLSLAVGAALPPTSTSMVRGGLTVL
jgi:hypothetical protein